MATMQSVFMPVVSLAGTFDGGCLFPSWVLLVRRKNSLLRVTLLSGDAPVEYPKMGTGSKETKSRAGTFVHCVTNLLGRQKSEFQFSLLCGCCEDNNLVAGLKKNRIIIVKDFSRFARPASFQNAVAPKIVSVCKARGASTRLRPRVDFDVDRIDGADSDSRRVHNATGEDGG